jgi:hypothetical protein
MHLDDGCNLNSIPDEINAAAREGGRRRRRRRRRTIIVSRGKQILLTFCSTDRNYGL